MITQIPANLLAFSKDPAHQGKPDQIPAEGNFLRFLEKLQALLRKFPGDSSSSLPEDKQEEERKALKSMLAALEMVLQHQEVGYILLAGEYPAGPSSALAQSLTMEHVAVPTVESAPVSLSSSQTFEDLSSPENISTRGTPEGWQERGESAVTPLSSLLIQGDGESEATPSSKLSEKSLVSTLLSEKNPRGFMRFPPAFTMRETRPMDPLTVQNEREQSAEKPIPPLPPFQTGGKPILLTTDEIQSPPEVSPLEGKNRINSASSPTTTPQLSDRSLIPKMSDDVILKPNIPESISGSFAMGRQGQGEPEQGEGASIESFSPLEKIKEEALPAHQKIQASPQDSALDNLAILHPSSSGEGKEQVEKSSGPPQRTFLAVSSDHGERSETRWGLMLPRNTVMFKLEPEELGSLIVQVRLTGKKSLEASFWAESSTMRTLLQNQLPSLNQALTQQGFHPQQLFIDSQEGFSSQLSSFTHQHSASHSFTSGHGQGWGEQRRQEQAQEFPRWHQKPEGLIDVMI